MSTEAKDNLVIFISVCIGSIVAVAIICFLAFFFMIEIQRMRNQTPQMQEYNACLSNVAAGNQYVQKPIDPGSSCKYLIGATK